MIFGTKSRFAVELSTENVIDDWVLGTCLFWAGGSAIGNADDHSVDLKGCCNWMQDFIDNPRDRYEPGLYDMDKIQAYIRLASSVLPGQNPSSFARETFKDTFSRFHISHLGMSSFDDVTLLLVKNSQADERLIWRKGTSEVSDFYLGAGEIEDVLAQVVDYCKAPGRLDVKTSESG